MSETAPLTFRRSSLQLFALLTALALFTTPAAALLPTAQKDHSAAPAIFLVSERPEMRSYQPYAGLQFGFRPTPPSERGTRSRRSDVVMPKRVAPLIEYGRRGAYSAQWYRYCADRFDGTLEPRADPFDSGSRQRTCR